MSEPILRFENIVFAYDEDGKTVLNELSLDIESNTVTAILGPNGVGKTTLLYLSMGWQRPQRGRVLLNGKALSTYSRRELGRWIGLVPQSEHVTYGYSLLEYVLLGRAPYLRPLAMPGHEDMRIAAEALEAVGLGHMKDKPVIELSGGERQLVLVARALAQQPRLLLLDEATSHLDLSNKLRLLKVIDSLLSQDITVLMTTHEPEVASSIASHLVLMRAGRVEHAGKLEEEFTGERLTVTYGVPVEVSEVSGQLIALWGHQNRRFRRFYGGDSRD